MELWDLYTAERVPTGEVIERGKPIPAGLFHLGVHAWIRNSEGKYLISQRSQKKDVLPLIPMGKLIAPEDIAETILFLASEQAKMLTGQVIKVSGGHAL